MTLLLDALIAGLLLGRLLGGRLQYFARSNFNLQGTLVGLLLASRLLQVGFGRFLPTHASLLLWESVAFISAGIAILNFRRQGMPLIAGGLLLNLLVVAVNAGMPVALQNIPASDVGLGVAASAVRESWFYVQSSYTTGLFFLADIIPVGGPWWHRGMMSLGDAFIAIGVTQYIARSMLLPAESSKRLLSWPS